MSDTRPQYGELATPEEQRLAAGLPPLGEVLPAVAAPEPAQEPAAAEPARRRPVDRFVTIALLAYGLINVVMTAMSYLDLPASMNQTMKMLGIDGEFTNFAQGRLWGTIAAIVLVVGWCVTAALSIRRLRRAKLSWWVPVVGATVTLLITSICIAVPMMGDPAFMAYVSSIGQ
jgi:energy-converting hydrogenase Eha subunit C